MKFLNVVPHYVPANRYGGPQRVAHGLGRALVRSGHHVVVCTTIQANEHEDLDVPKDEPVDVDGVIVHYEPVVAFRYWGFSPRLWRRAQSALGPADIVLVHSHYQFASWAGALLARRYHKPYVIFAHSSLHKRAITEKSRLKKELYLRFLEGRNMKGALFIAFNAPEEKACSRYGERGRVIPSGIDPQDFQPRPEQGAFRMKYPALRDKTIFLFLGRLDLKQKGLDMLLQAFGKLARQQPELHLVLAGPDVSGNRKQLENIAATAGIGENVTFTSLISGDQKLAALQDADAFVLPSRYEGQSIALLEALYMGLPVLVTDTVGLSQQIANMAAGIVVSPGVESIKDGLQTLAGADARAQLQGRGTYLIEQGYTWDIIAADFVSQLQSLLNQKYV